MADLPPPKTLMEALGVGSSEPSDLLRIVNATRALQGLEPLRELAPDTFPLPQSEPKRGRRANHEGSIYKRKKNGKEVWEASYTVGVRENGRPYRISASAPTETLAIERRALAYKRWLVRTGQADVSILPPKQAAIATNDLSTSDYLAKWFEWRKSRNTRKLSKNSVARYRTYIEIHIAPYIGKIPIRMLTRSDVEDLIFQVLPHPHKNPQTGEEMPPLGPASVNEVRKLLLRAVQWGTSYPSAEHPLLIKDVISHGLDTVEKKEIDYSFLRYATFLPEFLIAHFHDRTLRDPEKIQDELWIVFMSYGLRSGERLGLKWSDFIDLEEEGSSCTLDLRSQLQTDPDTGDLEITKTKTVSSRRLLPIDDRLRKNLIKYKALQDRLKKGSKWQQNIKDGKLKPEWEGLIFTRPNGTPISRGADLMRFKRFLNKDVLRDELGNLIEGSSIQNQLTALHPSLRNFHPHLMRHLAVSLLVNAGVPIEIVAKWVGHSDPETTRKWYTTISDEALLEAGRTLAANLYYALPLRDEEHEEEEDY